MKTADTIHTHEACTEVHAAGNPFSERPHCVGCGETVPADFAADIERQASTGPLGSYNPVATVTCPHCGGTMQAIDAKQHVWSIS